MAKDAYKAAPDDPDVSYTLGKLVFANGEYKYAASLFQQSALKRSDDPEISYDLARALYDIGRVSDAEDTMRKLVQPDVSFSRKSQASQFLDLLAIAENPGNTGADDPRIKRALQSDPTNAPALMAVAAIAQAKGDSKAASTAYEQILARYPDFTPAIRQLAIYLVENPANDSRTYDLATKARQAYPTDKEIARTLGMLSYRRGDFRSAARLLNESLPADSPNGQTLYYLGMAQYQLKNTKESKAALTQALGTNLPGQLATEAKRVLAELK
jgi:Flp pilus assembly protein TadD